MIQMIAMKFGVLVIGLGENAMSISELMTLHRRKKCFLGETLVSNPPLLTTGAQASVVTF